MFHIRLRSMSSIQEEVGGWGEFGILPPLSQWPFSDLEWAPPLFFSPCFYPVKSTCLQGIKNPLRGQQQKLRKEESLVTLSGLPDLLWGAVP